MKQSGTRRNVDAVLLSVVTNHRPEMKSNTALFGVVVLAVALAATAPAATAHEGSHGESNASVNVGLGQQLGVLISVSSDDVRTEFENEAFEFEFRQGDRLEAVNDRLEEVHERSIDLNEEYRELNQDLHEGEVSREEYARRVAGLNSRAENLRRSLEWLKARLNESGLKQAGVNRSALNNSLSNVDELTGLGPSALLSRFTSGAAGEIEIETRDGVSIEVESEGGESSREVRRDRDADDSITVNVSAARQSARESLTNRSWVLVEESLHEEDGYIEFEFVLDSNSSEGEAEVRVDGSTGTVFRVEEEVEPRDDDGELEPREDLEEDEDDEEDDEEEPEDQERVEDEDDGEDGMDDEDREDEREVDDLELRHVGGSPAPNATVSVRVVADGSPAVNASVHLNDEFVGTTDANGTLTLTLPGDTDEARLTGQYGDEDTELRFEFDEDEEEEEGDGY